MTLLPHFHLTLRTTRMPIKRPLLPGAEGRWRRSRSALFDRRVTTPSGRYLTRSLNCLRLHGVHNAALAVVHSRATIDFLVNLSTPFVSRRQRSGLSGLICFISSKLVVVFCRHGMRCGCMRVLFVSLLYRPGTKHTAVFFR